MRNALVTILSVSMLAAASLLAMPTNAQSQVVIVIGGGAAQPYYPPYAAPYAQPQTTVVIAGGYPGYGYRSAGYGYYNGYYGGGWGYRRGYYGAGYYGW